MSRPPRILGLMSGTSADGIDAVLLELPNFPLLGAGGPPPELAGAVAFDGAVPRGRVLAHHYAPYGDGLRAEVLRAARGEANTRDLAQLHFALGEALAEAARPLSQDADLIASHGQTVQHLPRPQEGPRATLQLGEASVVAQACGKDVIADFRPADLAAGGEAAPLVPFADRVLFAQRGVRRAVHNLGGISNLTYLPGLDPAGVLAFDTGPANALIDEAAELLGRRFDHGGQLAAGGRVNEKLLGVWARDPYLNSAPPKSTGREHWHLAALAGAFELPPRDLAATVTAFSARTVADAYRRFVLPLGLDEIVVAGGGAHNPVFLAHWRGALPGVPIRTFQDVGWAEFGFTASTREAAAFAVLGYYAAQGWANTLPHTTGARHAVVAGKLTRAPHTAR